MLTVNIHEAKTQLSRLIDRAVKGEPFVIAKAGKPLVKVAALDAAVAPQRLGFLAGEIAVPKDFDRMGADEIATKFGSAHNWPVIPDRCGRSRTGQPSSVPAVKPSD
jgi:prevent-host-death family protein